MGEGPARGWGRGGMEREPARKGGRRRGRSAPLAHPRIAARSGSPGPPDSRARGRPPRAGRREAHPARAPAVSLGLRLPLRCHLTPPPPPPPAEARLAPDPHPAWGEMLLLSLGCRSQEFDVIISQNGTEKLRVASFLPLCTVQKNLRASPRLQNGSDYRIKELRN